MVSFRNIRHLLFSYRMASGYNLIVSCLYQQRKRKMHLAENSRKKRRNLTRSNVSEFIQVLPAQHIRTVRPCPFDQIEIPYRNLPAEIAGAQPGILDRLPDGEV